MTLADSKDSTDHRVDGKSRLGLYVGGFFGLTGLAIMSLCTPFVLPALRKHCLPYVPATDGQLSNLRKAIRLHSKPDDKFLDIGSGDGRICRLGASLGIFSRVEGVELNYVLVLLSRVLTINSVRSDRIKYHHKDLWKFPIDRYDSICIFGVESMMDSFRDYLLRLNFKPQIIFACRFPIRGIHKIDEIGTGIDTVWVYQVPRSKNGAV